MQHVKVVDVDSGFCLVDKETNAWLKKRASYELSANKKTSSDKLSVDAKVMDHLYSLDGACPHGQPDYKPWNEPKFFMNINSELRSKVLLPLFKLDDQPIAPAVFYSVHAANIGWMDDVSSGEMAGTTGEARQLEAIKIWLNSKGSIFYSVHVAGKGWLPYVKNGEVAGTTGESRQMEAIKIRIENMPGYTVTYRVHMADKGWSDWVNNDAVAGTTGESRRIEAIEIKLIK